MSSYRKELPIELYNILDPTTNQIDVLYESKFVLFQRPKRRRRLSNAEKAKMNFSLGEMLIREIHFGNLGNPFGKANGNPLAGL